MADPLGAEQARGDPVGDDAGAEPARRRALALADDPAAEDQRYVVRAADVQVVADDQAWVRVNPVTALSDATRSLVLGGAVATSTWHSILWAIGITAVFAPLAVRRYRQIG